MKPLNSTFLARTLLVLDGPSIAGKGTQSKMLMEALPELGLVYLSSGEFFRLKAETAAKVEGGALFPDAEYIETISPAVDEQIRLADQLQPGFVFDGGVRKVFQAPAVKRMFAVRGATSVLYSFASTSTIGARGIQGAKVGSSKKADLTMNLVPRPPSWSVT